MKWLHIITAFLCGTVLMGLFTVPTPRCLSLGQRTFVTLWLVSSFAVGYLTGFHSD